MRRNAIALGLCFALLSGGCDWLNRNLLKKNTNDPISQSGEKPTPEKLVAYLNRNAAQVETLQVADLAIEAKMGLGVARSIELRGTLQAQKPRFFRMEGYVPGAKTEVVDLGSNDREFWFWIAENKPPYLFYCSHTDLPRATLPLPIHPDWIMEAMGMATVNPSGRFRIDYPRNADTIELIEDTVSPQGTRTQKVTVFNRRNVTGTQPQVVARKLLDAQGKLICLAEIKQMQQDPRSGVSVPHRLDLVCPGDRSMDKITLSLVLDTLAVNVPIDQSMAQMWFNRPSKPGVQAFDLARSGAHAAHPTDLQPAGATIRGNRR